MHHSDAHSHTIPAPGAHPGVSRWRDLIAHDENRLALVAVGRVEIVLRPDAKALESRVEPCLLEQGRPITGAVDHDPGPQFLGWRSHADDVFTIPQRGLDPGGKLDAGAGR